jgi:hypothetical protein
MAGNRKAKSGALSHDAKAEALLSWKYRDQSVHPSLMPDLKPALPEVYRLAPKPKTSCRSGIYFSAAGVHHHGQLSLMTSMPSSVDAQYVRAKVKLEGLEGN